MSLEDQYDAWVRGLMGGGKYAATPKQAEDANDAVQQMQAQLKHMDEIILRQNELRAFRHDINNQLTALSGYLDAGDLAGSRQYLAGISDHFKSASLAINTGNNALDAILSAKRALAENHGIIFIDEIDKIAETNVNGGGAGVSREGVQRDILPIVEGSVVKTKYGPIKTDHILFIAAGAFHVSKPEDLIPELQGRFPYKVQLHSLDKHDIVRILTETEHSLPEKSESNLESADRFRLFPHHTEPLATIPKFI